ncbi:MAG TPA: HEAT repeat domain-containing protein, partial [Gemmataceae bacterium]|nr:HEAT repeat domain-containing protein [Gemmataceae bacterium]
QGAAVLALGRIDDPRDFGRLRELLTTGRPGVRAAAARALTQQATPSGPETARRARALRGEVVPALQKALDDPAWEVVVEAAEDLGSLGVPEAGPVLIALLHHPCEPVRQTAAQALERVADLTILDGLLTASTDSAVSVRFSLVGALGHAAADGRSLGDGQRARLVAGLEDLLLRDPDPAVRSRAATVLGACGTPDVLPVLWQRVLAAEDNRVQDKAWAAVINIIARTECLHLLNEWEHRLAEAGQVARRLELLGAVCDRWKKTERGRDMATPATEALVEAELEQKKWAAAFPLVRELLTRTGTKAELSRRLGWLLAVARQALHEGNRSESLRAAQEAQPFLAGHPELAAAFETLAKKARQGP